MERHYLTHTVQYPTYSIPHKIKTWIEDGKEQIIGGNVTCTECALIFAKMKKGKNETD